jgi:sec-independent protein translocase protein TatA
MELLFIGGLGTTEVLLIVLVLLLLFGGKKLPELMRGAGRGIREFKDAVNTATTDIESDKKPAEKKEEKAE